MADKLTGGDTVFTTAENSMAAAIERHINALLPEPFPDGDPDDAVDRRRLFAGIARGVIEHLVHNPEALKIVITQAPGGHEGQYKGRVVIKATDVS